jgi:large subunit ribosomal protein L18
MDKNKSVNRQRRRRSLRVRNQLRSNLERPRLSVHRSLKHFGCQVVDDESGRTLVSASTRDKSVRDSVSGAETATQLR